MIEWFKNLSEGWQIAMFGAGVTFIGGLFALIKWLFRKKDGPSPQSIKINTGIDPNNLVDLFGKTKEELGQANEKIRHLEEQLAKHRIETSIASEQSTPTPSAEAKELAKLITEDDGPYAQALKAIAEGNSKRADEFLDQTQQLLDNVQQVKDKAQAKIYFARMQNAYYASKYLDAREWADKLAPIADDDAQILSFIGIVYHENALFQKAEFLMRRSLEIDEKSFGKDHPYVAIDLNNLAQLLQVTNRLKEAEPLMRRALQIDETSLGKDHPNVAIDLNNLAILLKDTNRLKEVEPLMRRVIEIWEKSLGPDHPNVATALNNLAEFLRETRRYKEAEPLYHRALQIDETSFGKDHPTVAIRLNNLALLLQDTNRLTEAEPLMRRALEIAEKSFGPDHPNVANALNNLALLFKATNRLKEAEPLYRRALQIDETSFGKDHPTVAIRLNNLAVLLQATNRLKEAEPLMERHLVISLQFTRQTGHPHPHLHDAINNYAGLLIQMGLSNDEITNRLKRLAPEMFK